MLPVDPSARLTEAGLKLRLTRQFADVAASAIGTAIAAAPAAMTTVRISSGRRLLFRVPCREE